MLGKSEVLQARIDELTAAINAMESENRMSKRRQLLAKRAHDKANKELEKTERKLGKLDKLLYLERLAEIWHEQWMAWTKEIAERVPDEVREIWEEYWIPYDELPVGIKNKYRGWARKVRDEK